MAAEVSWNPGAVAAGTNIDLPADAPPIASVISARLLRPSGGVFTGSALPDHLHTIPADASATTEVAEIRAADSHLAVGAGGHVEDVSAGTPAGSVDAGSVVSPTPTKVDENTITLNADTQARDLLVLRYEQVGELVKV